MELSKLIRIELQQRKFMLRLWIGSEASRVPRSCLCQGMTAENDRSHYETSSSFTSSHKRQNVVKTSVISWSFVWIALPIRHDVENPRAVLVDLSGLPRRFR
jgi:hypothetical protein